MCLDVRFSLVCCSLFVCVCTFICSVCEFLCGSCERRAAVEAERTAEQEIQGGITAKEMKMKSSSRRSLPGGPEISSSSRSRSSKNQDGH